MYHLTAIAASLVSLGLVCAIHYCNIRSAPGGWLRSDLIAMILVALLIGMYPLALAASLAGLWAAFAGGISTGALLAAGADLVSLAVILAATVVFRATVKATYRAVGAPDTITPLTPRPMGPAAASALTRRAA